MEKGQLHAEWHEKWSRNQRKINCDLWQKKWQQKWKFPLKYEMDLFSSLSLYKGLSRKQCIKATHLCQPNFLGLFSIINTINTEERKLCKHMFKSIGFFQGGILHRKKLKEVKLPVSSLERTPKTVSNHPDLLPSPATKKVCILT